MTNQQAPSEPWEKRFWSKFNIAYIHKKGWATLGLEVVDFIRQVRKEAVEETKQAYCVTNKTWQCLECGKKVTGMVLAHMCDIL